jgi:hypothetical protein
LGSKRVPGVTAGFALRSTLPGSTQRLPSSHPLLILLSQRFPGLRETLSANSAHQQAVIFGLAERPKTRRDHGLMVGG